MQDDSLMTAVQSLPDKYRIPLYLHYYEGYKTHEIAEMGGKTCEQGV